MPAFHLQPARRRLLALALALAPSLFAQGQIPRYPLTVDTVAAALVPSGVVVDASQIELPAGLTAAGPHPQLQFASAELLPQARLRVRMSCVQKGDCQPFWVTVRQPSASVGLDALTRLQRSVTAAPGESTSSDVVGHLQAGQHATLLLEDAHMRITVPVIVIDSGRPGTEVRASSLDRKQIYRAVVADAGTLRGTLP